MGKKSNFIESISYRNEIITLNKKKELAEKLMGGKLKIADLSDRQVDEMTEYFKEYIDKMEQELTQTIFQINS